jgi:hypothetical protein
VATRRGARVATTLARTRPQHVHTPGCTGHYHASARTASTRPLGAAIWYLKARHETARWHTWVPCKQDTTRWTAHRHYSSHGDGKHKGMSGPGAPIRRRAAVLRREGQHTGMVNMVARLDVVGASQERDQGGGKGRTVAVCSRRVGGVVVAGSVLMYTSA